MKSIVKIISAAFLVCMLGLLAVPASAATPVVAPVGDDDITPDREAIPWKVLVGGNLERELCEQGEIIGDGETPAEPQVPDMGRIMRIAVGLEKDRKY